MHVNVYKYLINIACVYADKLLLHIHVHLVISVPYLISAMNGKGIFKNSEVSCVFICLDEGNKACLKRQLISTTLCSVTYHKAVFIGIGTNTSHPTL